MIYMLLFFLEKGLHCLKLETSKETKTTENDHLHTINVLVRYNGGNTSLFTWKGAKNGGKEEYMPKVKELCQPLQKNISGLVYVEDAWISQRGSNNTWFAKSIFVQENVEAPYYAQYALNPSNPKLWTDGYSF